MLEKEASVAGAVTYWSLSSETDFTKLVRGFDPLGYLDAIPIPHDGSQALKSALNKTFSNRQNGRMVRARKNPDENGFEIVQETRGENKNKYDMLTNIRVKDDVVSMFPSDDKLLETIQQAYLYQKMILDLNQVGTMLVNIVERLDGRTLRPRGAIYWLPEISLVDWKKIAGVVEGSSLTNNPNSVFLLRTLFDNDAVRAVKDAVIRDIQEKANSIHLQVEEKNLGERAFRSRARDAAELHNRIQMYEAILGETLDGLHEFANQTEQDVVTAAIAAFPDTFSL